MKRKMIKNLYVSNVWRSTIGVILWSVLIIGSAGLIGLMLINEVINYPSALIIGKVMLIVCSLIAASSVLINVEKSFLHICLFITIPILMTLLIYSAFSKEGITGQTVLNCVLVIIGVASALTIRLKMKVKVTRRKRAYR